MQRYLLTFDYELFFGECEYDYTDVLIEPTNLIANCLDKFGIKATFFVDTPSVIAYKKQGISEYSATVKKQLNDLLNRGHDIQLHIHPIWYKAKFNAGKWYFDNEYYAFSSYENIETIINQSKDELDKLCLGNDNYMCCAFRAGGFCLEPEHKVLSALKKNSIHIDSSVYPRAWLDTYAQQFDYRYFKKYESSFFLPEYGLMKRISNISKEAMLEIPVGGYSKVPHKWYLTHCMPELNYPEIKGQRTPQIQRKKHRGISKILNHIHDSLMTPVLFTVDNLHKNALFYIFNHYTKKYKNKENYIALIGHPKFQSKKSVDNLFGFLELVTNATDYKSDTFLTMRDLNNKYFRIPTKGNGIE